MSMNQRCAWIQLLIFAMVLVGWIILFVINGTIFYWQDESMMMTFYILSALGFASLVLLNLTVSLLGRRGKIISDERDKSIWRKASLWATGTSYTVVVTLLLLLSIIYMNQGSESISVYFPLLIVIIGGVALLLTQAITAILLYNRKVNYSES